MLKKAGIVVAVAAAGLAALTPLAFASDPDGHGATSSDSRVDLDYTSVERDNQTSACEFEQNSAVTGVGGLLGLGVGIPFNAAVPVLSCNNVDIDDVVDVNTDNDETEVNGSIDD